MMMGVAALLFVAGGMWAYGCSGDEIYEEEDVHALAKRSMKRVGESTDADFYAGSSTCFQTKRYVIPNSCDV